MKKINIISIISISLIAISCSSPSVEKEQNETVKTSLDGEALMKTNCLVCHGNGTSHETMIAPPMMGVKRHYINDEITEEQFVEDITNWVNNPSEDNVKMFGAVRKFGIMPKQEFNPEEIKSIATYIYNNKMEKPVWFDKHMEEEH